MPSCRQWHSRAGRGAGNVGTDTGWEAGNLGCRQGIRHQRLCGGVRESGSDAAGGTEHRAEHGHRHRRANHPPTGIRNQLEEEEENRRVLRLVEGYRAPAKSADRGIHKVGRLFTQTQECPPEAG